MAHSNEPLKDAPDPQFIELLRAITGLENISDAELTKPILRPTIQDTYILYIIQYALLSVIGVVANSWAIYYISKHKLYRDNTHSFFINLSMCHFVQSAFVVPVTLITTIVHNWILGTFMCYFVPMLQVSGSNSIFRFFNFNNATSENWTRVRECADWNGVPLMVSYPYFFHFGCLIENLAIENLITFFFTAITDTASKFQQSFIQWIGYMKLALMNSLNTNDVELPGRFF